MKKLLLLVLLFSTAAGFSQNKIPRSGSDNMTYALANLDEKPELVGNETFKDFFKKNFQNPDKGNGPLKMSFTIEKSGLALDVKVMEGAGDEVVKEAKRVLKSAGKWKPGKKDGKIVRVRYSFTYVK
ncbi:MAG TPA: energy transducer TonB [Flavobacterium sp.]|nr:energy transducer TonB [Flavobacterium sp.]